jgi:hypothetical protein
MKNLRVFVFPTIMLGWLPFLFISPFAFGQTNGMDGKELIRKMNDVYANSKSVSMSFEVNYFELSSQLDPTTRAKGEVKYSGRNYYSDAMGQVVLVNKNYSLIIDKAQHTITCLPGSEQSKKEKQAQANAQPGGAPDSSWAAATKVKLLDQQGDSRRVEIIGNDGIYEKTILKINAKTYALEEVVYYYKKLENGSSPKLVVTYSSIKFNAVINEADFSEKKYIQKKNGKLIASPAWSNYEVIDLTSGIDIK